MNVVYCFLCRTEMVEVRTGTFYCRCRVLSDDPMIQTQLDLGWLPCLDCWGNGCVHCNHLGTFLPTEENNK